MSGAPMAERPHNVPIATYRVQMHAAFDFARAAEIADYLVQLGVSHFYSSPYLQASAGSTHGYDVVDHTRVNRELGGPDAHGAFCRRLAECRLGQVLDIVPNHMGIPGPDNAWWWDVLTHGRQSRYARYFDVDWDAPETRVRGRILLPVLGDHVGRAVDAGELRLARGDGGHWTIRYHDHAFPVAPGSAEDLLTAAGGDGDAAAKRVSADSDAMLRLLERQPYRLAWWRLAGHELNYRRFFDINQLVGLRVEDEEVFEATHAEVLKWVDAGLVDGLRVDHPDGLRDPKGYFQRLRERAGDAWIVAEKILQGDEPLPGDWPIDGTTGYDFLNCLQGLYVDPAAEPVMTAFYGEFTGEPADYAEVLRAGKVQVLRESFGGELNRLTQLALETCQADPRQRDWPRAWVRGALEAMIVAFPVYRTYIRPREPPGRQDEQVLARALEEARRLRPALDGRLFEFLGEALRLRTGGHAAEELVARFQQLTSPVTAKGAEDTAFYRYHRLVCLNEVGGDPGRFGTSVDAFHRACLETQRRWPGTMLAGTTHDTKRSEDVRARLALVSEIPGRWREAVSAWSTMNDRHRTAGLPDRNAEYLLYQTLAGAWPIGPDRLVPYMLKAAREAKQHTSWTDPDESYEAALRRFVERVLGDAGFRASVEAFVAPLVEPGRLTSLSQTLIRLTAPGVPDLYQGTELWELSLVDPDNRRPVDYAARRALLAEVADASPENAMARMDAGAPKLYVVHRALRVRRRFPEAFGRRGEYQPLLTRGVKADHAVAFCRGNRVVTVAPRLVMGLGGAWGDTAVELPEGTWRSEWTGESVRGGRAAIGDLLNRFPVALLWREG